METWQLIVSICAGLGTILGLISKVVSPIRQLIEDNEKRDEELKFSIGTLTRKVNDICDKVDTNEKDRIKAEIFRYGNIARQKKSISIEEFRYLQEDFEKYTAMGGNGVAHDEFSYITEYFNSQF